MGNACFLPRRITRSRPLKLPDVEIGHRAHHRRRHNSACRKIKNTNAALANDYEAEEQLRLSPGSTGIDWEAEKFIRNRLKKMNDEYMEEVSSINSS